MSQRRTVIVTGGGRGIGRAIAQRMLQEGYAVVLAEIDPQLGTRSAELLGEQGEVLFVPTDVARESSVQRTVEKTVDTFGRVDAVVNNAATSAGGPLELLSLGDWNRVVGVNLTGPMLLAKHSAPHLRSAGGSIVNIASTRALMSEPNTEAYSATKGGLVALTHALAMSLAPVRVNSISPGWIYTADYREGGDGWDALREVDHAQHPVGRVGRPEDVADLTAWLCGDRNGFVTGQNFVIDGGMTRKMIYEEGE
ncbi:MAG: glucose 1-dehydrogenase [Phycisphaerae bacterium]